MSLLVFLINFCYNIYRKLREVKIERGFINVIIYSYLLDIACSTGSNIYLGIILDTFCLETIFIFY